MISEDNNYEPIISEVINHLRMNSIYNKFVLEIQAKKISAAAARNAGLRVTDDELQKSADSFRLINGLEEASVFKKWLTNADFSLEDFEDYLERNILVSKFKDKLLEDAKKSDFLSKGKLDGPMREIAYQDWLAKKLNENNIAANKK